MRPSFLRVGKRYAGDSGPNPNYRCTSVTAEDWHQCFMQTVFPASGGWDTGVYHRVIAMTCKYSANIFPPALYVQHVVDTTFLRQVLWGFELDLFTESCHLPPAPCSHTQRRARWKRS